MASTRGYAGRRGAGWIAFAGIMLILAGLIDIVNGLWALGAEATRIDAVFFDNDLDAWGWFYLILGIVLVATGFGVFQRAPWAVSVGIAFAVVAAVLHMLWIFRYPIASLILVMAQRAGHLRARRLRDRIRLATSPTTAAP